MKTTEVNPESTCPQCGRPLRAPGLGGLCPACLLAQGQGQDSGASDASGAPARDRFVAPTVEEVARLFPHLEVVRLLGAGGMGAVYQARQPSLDRWVALKVLPRGGADAARSAERFNREARALARLSHPHIVAVYEFGDAGGMHYFLMEYVDGTNLRQLERTGRLSSREALQIIPQICDALQYAHDSGVVHRDIKPENVLIDRKGRVKIADFGLARILEAETGEARLTMDGQVMGTPHYMAPEQVERPLAVDHRADIYALGVVFYEMLTGELPIGKFSPPSRKVEVDVRLDEIVLRALENDPDRRYQQASEVKQRVETVAETPAPAGSGSAAAPEAGQPAEPRVRYLRWAGIPVVKERDGEREVYFHGALGAAFLTFVVAHVAGWAVRWLAGTESSLTTSSVSLALLWAVWGIRRTMNQPWEDESLPKAAHGTVILPPRKRVPFLQDYAMLVALFVALVGGHFLKVRYRAWRQSGTVATGTNAIPGSGAGPLVWSRTQDLRVDELADLDTGGTANFPSGQPGEPFFAGVGDDVLWAVENGFDVSAGNGELQFLNLEWVRLAMEDWDRLAPTEVEARLQSGGSRDPVLRPDAEELTTAVYGFRTREKGVGLLRILEFDEMRPGARIRIKRVEKAGNLTSIRAVRDPHANRWVAGVPSGGSIELVGLAASDGPPDAWWRPDGRPVPGLSAALLHPGRMSPTDARLRDVLFRLRKLEGPGLEPTFQFEKARLHRPAGQIVASGTDGRQDADDPGILRGAQVDWPTNASRAFIRVGLPRDDWHSIGSYEPLSRSFSRTRLGDDPEWNIRFQTAGEAASGGVTVTLVFGADHPDRELRVVARRTGGDLVVGTLDVQSPFNGISSTRTYAFHHLRLAEVANFQVQARALDWVEFPDVMLLPPEPSSSRREGRAYLMERQEELSGWLNLDSGASGDGEPPAGLGAHLWVGTNGIRCRNLRVIELASMDWQYRWPGSLNLLQPLMKPVENLGVNPGQLPLTLGFATPNPGLGILQVLEFDPGQRRATIRFRRVEPRTEVPPVVPRVHTFETRP